MTAPLQKPPALHDRALQDLSFIRRTMEGASSFTDVPGWGLATVGATAIGAALLADLQPLPGRWLAVWFAEAFLAATIAAGMMWRKIRRRAPEGSAKVLSMPARKFLLGFWPAIFAGAVLTFSIVDFSALSDSTARVPEILPGLWLLLYGLGVLTAGAFSVRAVPLLGVCLMGLGAFALFVPALPSALALALGFGVLQIAFGVFIARRHGG